MLKRGLPALPRLRHGLAAGEPLLPALRAAWRAATGTDLHEALGMTEVSTYVSGSPARPAPEGTAGFPQPGRRLAVLGPEGPLGPGAPGELAVHRSDPGLMLGYWQDPEATAARFRDDWFRTGDLSEWTAEGALRVLGRADDVMNPGGYRVAPLEVELALTHLGLREAAVAEVEVAPGTRVIGCFYAAEAEIDPEAARTSLVRTLAPWKLPRLWIRLDALPRNANLKLDRKALAQLARKASHDPS
jgi:acyl-coenzyme A synthetase/AMP-(fatty) acid ligase